MRTAFIISLLCWAFIIGVVYAVNHALTPCAALSQASQCANPDQE